MISTILTERKYREIVLREAFQDGTVEHDGVVAQPISLPFPEHLNRQHREQIPVLADAQLLPSPEPTSINSNGNDKKCDNKNRNTTNNSDDDSDIDEDIDGFEIQRGDILSNDGGNLQLRPASLDYSTTSVASDASSFRSFEHSDRSNTSGNSVSISTAASNPLDDSINSHTEDPIVLPKEEVNDVHRLLLSKSGTLPTKTGATEEDVATQGTSAVSKGSKRSRSSKNKNKGASSSSTAVVLPHDQPESWITWLIQRNSAGVDEVNNKKRNAKETTEYYPAEGEIDDGYNSSEMHLREVPLASTRGVTALSVTASTLHSAWALHGRSIIFVLIFSLSTLYVAPVLFDIYYLKFGETEHAVEEFIGCLIEAASLCNTEPLTQAAIDQCAEDACGTHPDPRPNKPLVRRQTIIVTVSFVTFCTQNI